MDRAEQIVLIKFIQNSIGTNMDFGAAFFAAFLKHTFCADEIAHHVNKIKINISASKKRLISH